MNALGKSQEERIILLELVASGREIEMAGKLLELRSKRRRKHLAFPLPIF
jgi:hypothetical protein